jgi:membrane protein DedA with SNARE-associated domain
MKLKNCLIPTVIGTLPRALFYTSLGGFFGVTFNELLEVYRETGEIPQNLQNMISNFNFVLFAVVVVMGAILIGYWLVTRRYSEKGETKSI